MNSQKHKLKNKVAQQAKQQLDKAVRKDKPKSKEKNNANELKENKNLKIKNKENKKQKVLNEKITPKNQKDKPNNKFSKGNITKIAKHDINIDFQNNTPYTIIPLRNMIVHPKLIMSLFIGRAQSIKAIQQHKTDKPLLFLLQKDPEIDHPKEEDFHKIGTLATILRTDFYENTMQVSIQGHCVCKIESINRNEAGFFEAIVSRQEIIANVDNLEAQIHHLKSIFQEYLTLKKEYSTAFLNQIDYISDEPALLIDFISAYIEIDCLKKQKLLEQTLLSERFYLLNEYLQYAIENIRMSNKISEGVKKKFDEHQKRFMLSTQLDVTKKALEALGGEEDTDGDNFKEQMKALDLSKEAREKAEKEIIKLKNMSSFSSEATVIRNYLDCLLGLPWGKSKKVNYDLKHAQEELNKNHAGLKSIKDRIYEMIAVESRVGTAKAPILCFYGPPGVGKTSLARSIANATGREFISISLGGLHDEAEIRGHRSTYIGAKPGKIIQGLKRAKSDNPVFLLDEIGEIGQDMRSNPAAALLEILDPEHRHEFRDNFLEVAWPFDKAMVIASTNRLDTLPQALIDRMEIIKLSGYTKQEKLTIAQQHLVNKQMKANGVSEHELAFTDQALEEIIAHYTKEAGVRDLERKIARICRKVVAYNMMENKAPQNTTAYTHILDNNAQSTRAYESSSDNNAQSTKTHNKNDDQALETNNIHFSNENFERQVIITADLLQKYLGPALYKDEHNIDDKIGVASGLAWTSVGGEILFVEAVTTKGDGKITLTGKLGDVMKESVYAAWSVVKARAIEYLPQDHEQNHELEKLNVHVHLPEGATPKDGPSAGVALCVALMSAVTKRAVRGDIAMTGEVNLQGKVLKIGGLKEKLLAAIENKVKTVFIPSSNAYELEEIQSEINLNTLNIKLINDVNQVLEVILKK